MTSDSTLDAEYARKLDDQDELRSFRSKFVIKDPDLIYVDGNSLGRLPAATVALMDDIIGRQWGERLIRGWNEGWYDLPERLGEKMSSLLGARPDEVIFADSTSINLYKLAMAAMEYQSGRSKLLTDDLNFPSDLYILQSVVRLIGSPAKVEMISSADQIYPDIDALLSAIDEDTALISLSHTVFKSGYTYDMDRIGRAARRVGALVLWDTSHSAGAVPISLNAAGVDLAIGCSYKYLNGGPGAPAFIFVRRDLQDKLANPITGWMGQRNPFKFALEYEATDGLRRFLSGTPPILSLAALEVGIDILLEAGMDRLRTKSLGLNKFFMQLFESRLYSRGFTMKSPTDLARLGSHVTLGHEEGWRINQALIQEMKVLPDFRQPNNIRLGFAPLYNSFLEVFQLVARIVEVVDTKLYAKYEKAPARIT